MDRQLTERMVGAALLLGALVVVVPLVLDGRGQQPADPAPDAGEPLDLRTHTIHLDGAERAPPVPRPLRPQTSPQTLSQSPGEPPPPDRAPAATPVPGPAASLPPGTQARAPDRPPEPAPAAVPGAPPSPAPLPPSAAAVPAPKPAATPPAGNLWYVQLGSFSSRANADRLAAELKGKGYAATVSPLRSGSGSTLYRVRAGGEADREDAAALGRRLADAGYRGQVVR